MQIDGLMNGNYYGLASSGVAQVQFADGTALTRQQLIGLTTTGTAGADSLYGTGAADTFDGEGAPTGTKDVETGNGGADTFVYKQGYGQLEINEGEDQYGHTPTAATLQLGAGITAAQVIASNDGQGNIILTDGTPGDRVQIDGMASLNYYGKASSGVGSIVFADGTAFTRDQIVALAASGGFSPLASPKIVVGAVTAPAQALSGQLVPITWTLTNQGTAAGPGPWSDEVFVASDAAGDNAVSLGVFTYQGAIGIGQTVTQAANVILPASLAGNEWIVVKASATAQAVAAAPVVVTRSPAPNLVVTNITAPSTALSGQSTQVSWTVTNTGTVGTSASAWHDNVYLSLDQALDTTSTRFVVASTNTDPLLASVANPSYLAPGQSYTSTATVTLPQGISGPYYLIVGADAGGEVYADPSGTSAYTVSSVFGIVASSVPDLQVTRVIAPPQAFSGQPLTLNWTVENTGSVAATAAAWTDQILMSTDGALDSNSVVIGSVAHSGPLAAGASYTGTATLSLPVGVAGNATFYVVADAQNQVYEGALHANNTGSTTSPTTVALTPPPDLVVALLTSPAIAIAGHPISYSYTITNAGATVTPNASWTDSVYLSAKPTLDGTAILLGTSTHVGALDVGQSYTVTDTQTLGAGVSGPYYLLVQTNAGGQVFELNHANDLAASPPIVVTNAPPGLVVTGVTAPSGGLAGHQVSLSWQVTNTGTGDTSTATWSDTVVLSASGILGAADNIVLATVAGPSGPLAAGASYSQSAAVELPLAANGSYSLFVVTNPDPFLPAPALPVGFGAKAGFVVTQLLSALEVTSVTGPAAVVAGATATVQWTVINGGAAPTDAAYWYDDVYLSTTPGVAGTLLGQVRHVNSLGAGSSYTASGSFVLPPDLAAGSYTFVVAADALSQVTELSHVGNTGSSASVAVAAGTVVPVAPLEFAVSQVTSPAEIVSGQPLAVSYTVSNVGTATSGTWYDAVYLSHNQVLGSASDIYLGYVNNTALAAGSSRVNTQQFSIPVGQTGSLYLIVQSNAGALAAGSTGATATFATSALQVDLPSPVSLVVAGITVPPTAAIGSPVTLGYTVQNTSDFAETGSWYDALYLSVDGVWSPGDPLIGTVLHTGGVAANGGYAGTLTAALPGVAPGQYEVIVRTNILSESPGTNATGVSASTVAVTMPTLVFGTPATGSLVTSGSAYYQFTVAAGQTVDLSVLTDKPDSINNIYIRHGALPTRGQFDATSANPSVADPTALIRVTQPGTYYVLVTGNSVDGAEAFTLNAQAVGFTISHITPDYGSNLGSVTLTIDGAKFNANEQVQVVAADGTLRAATSVAWVNGTEVWATFDLRGLAVGSYAVAIGDGTQAATLPHAFQVTNGPDGQASVSLVLPQYLRAGQTGVVQVDYANTGQTDIAAPVIDLNSAQALLSGAGIAGSTQDITFVGTNPDGPAGILQPGAAGSVSFSFAPINPQPHEKIGFDVGILPATAPAASRTGATSTSTTTDWAAIWREDEAASRPASVDAADWHNVWAEFTQTVGTTNASVTTALSNVATELSQVGQAISNIDTLLKFELFQATGALAGGPLATVSDIAGSNFLLGLALTRTYSGTLLDRDATGPFGNGWVSNFDVTAIADGSGTVFIKSAGNPHLFTLSANGTYSAASGDASTLTVSGGLFRLRDGSGAVEQFRADGKLVSVIDANGNTVKLTYTASGVLQQVASATTGETISFTSNAQGRITSAQDSNGQQVTYSYNAAGKQLLSVSGPGGATQYGYVAPSGAVQDNALTSITYPDSTQRLFTYNAQGWLASQSGSGGAGLQTYAYDGAGRVSVTNAVGATTTNLYGANGAVAETQDALGNAVQVGSNAAGQATSIVTPGGSSLAVNYDSAGNLVGLTDALGGTVSATYAPGTTNLTGIKTQLGAQTTYTRDAAGNVTAIIYQDGSGTTYNYAPSGLLLKSTDADGITNSYSYDSAGHLLKQAFGDGTSNQFTYDAAGRVLTATGQTGATTSYAYDAAGRLTGVTDPSGRVLSYGYNALGQLATRTLPDGTATQYIYDSAGRLAALHNGSGGLLERYSYDVAGQLVQSVTGNGASTTYRYDLDGRTTEILNRNADGSVASRYGYAYDANSHVVAEATSDGNWAYGYDAAGELTTANFASTNPAIQSQALAYTYDAAGNRVSQTVNGVTTAYTTNALNQYAAVGGTQYAYDADGNVISETNSAGTITFTYNEGKQLVAQSGPAGTFQYSYDALGNLVSTTQNGVTSNYVNDPLSLAVSGQALTSVAQVYGSGNIPSTTYIYGQGLAAISNAGGVSYFNTDAVGNIVGVSGASGILGESASYLPYGQKLSTSGAATSNFGFSGTYGVTTSGSGLVDLRARFYDPNTGRFLSQDPSGVSGGTNLYRFANNNPVAYADPTGNFAFLIPYAIGAGIGAIGGAAGSIASQVGQDANGNATPINWPDVGRAAVGGAVAGLSPVRAGAGLVAAAGAPFIKGALGGLLPKLLFPSAHAETPYITPQDPNDIVGPASFGPESFISSKAPLAFIIEFENADTATAPAQDVIVTQQLDAGLDWNSFRLTGFGFDNLVYTLNGKNPFYTAQLDLTATKGYLLDVSAGVDIATGIVTWTFNTIDPATGQKPADPLAGFLPVNNAANDGQAFVSYTIQAKAGVKTGDVLSAQATVVFDTQGPISTAVVTNTFDTKAPTSSVHAMELQTDNPTFEVSWTGVDDPNGSGISGTTIYVAEDGGPAIAWLTNTTLNNALFTGQLGHSYAFSSQATDNTGNVEALHTTPDASIVVGHLDPGPSTVPGNLVVGHGQTISLTTLINGLVTPGLAGDTESVTAVSAAEGTVSLSGTGAITYVAPATGDDVLSYTVADQLGDTAAGKVVITGAEGPGGPDTLVLRLSEDAWLGDAQFTATVDGVQLAPAQAVTALHGLGQSQDFTFTGDFGAGPHQVGVTFLNDATGGTPSKDRNLYVDSISLDGTATPSTSATFYSAGMQTFSVAGPAPATPVATSANPDTLVLHLSEDAWLGAALFTATVDGKQLGAAQAVTALHGLGQSQDFTFTGDFGAGAHDLAVTFLNDASGGTAATDRNLYVGSADLDSVHYAAVTGPLMSDGALHFQIGAPVG